jgi:hypothetical protein
VKTLIYARVVAKPIHFPDEIEMIYHCLDKQDHPTGEVRQDGPFTWDDVGE